LAAVVSVRATVKSRCLVRRGPRNICLGRVVRDHAELFVPHDLNDPAVLHDDGHRPELKFRERLRTKEKTLS
jgi:hypothetical protein